MLSLILAMLSVCTWRILPVLSDYECLCNYRVELAVHPRPDPQSTPLGYLYEFDCKPTTTQATFAGQSGWRALVLDHQVGYVPISTSIQIQSCPGTPQFADTLTTTPTQPTTRPAPTTQQPTVAQTSGSTNHPTRSTTELSSNKQTTTTKATMQTTTPQPTTTTKLPTTPTKLTKSVTTRTTVTTQTITTHAKSSTLTTIKSILFTANPTTLKTHTTTTPPMTAPLTQHVSKSTVRHNHHIKTSPSFHNFTLVPWTTHKHHTTVRPVTSKPTAHWTQHWIVHPTTAGHGDLSRCPNSIVHGTWQKNLRQYKNSCYELVRSPGYWNDAKQDCRSLGGELVHITSQDEQDYLVQFLRENHYNRAVWIGLTDKNHEEHFTWTSGDSVTYTNWLPGRKGNFHPHGQEDCVLMTSYQQGGLWDDVSCRGAIFDEELHPWICQYDTHIPHHNG